MISGNTLKGLIIGMALGVAICAIIYIPAIEHIEETEKKYVEADAELTLLKIKNTDLESAYGLSITNIEILDAKYDSIVLVVEKRDSIYDAGLLAIVNSCKEQLNKCN